MAKQKYLNIRISGEDEQLINYLTEVYDLDRTSLVKYALEYIRQTQPIFRIAPQGKAEALSLEPMMN